MSASFPENKMQFKLGQVVATPGAIRAMEENGIEAWSLLSRHANGDWGCVPEEDRLENQRSVEEGYRVMSSYVMNDHGNKLWIITEADRSSTCLLLPEEY
jgi:hypothetical protein